MKPFMNFIKSNPIIVGSIVLAIVAIVGLVMLWPSGSALSTEMSQRSADIAKIDALMKTRMVVPPEKPDGAPREVVGVVNNAAIEGLKRAYGDMTDKYTAIFNDAVSFNQMGHRVMLDGIVDASGRKTYLFPEPSQQTMQFDAKDVYRATLLALLRDASVSPDFASVRAKPRYTDAEVAVLLEAVEKDFLVKRFPLDPAKQKIENLAPEQVEEMNKLQLKKLFEMHEARAKAINIYAAIADDFDALKDPDFPLHVGQWSLDSPAPRMPLIWEGQVGLWIQQDLIRAIALTNRVSDPQANVLNSPIKRLIRITVLDGYVGGQGGTSGGMAGGTLASGETRPGAPTSPTFPGAPPIGPSGYPEQGLNPQAVETVTVNSVSADKPLPDDFRISHTGRQGNDLYDVKHAQITVHIAASEINTFINNLAQVNFITVLAAKVTDVDEYELFNQGYVYGKHDVVELELLLESIWLRDWTKRYMPPEVRRAVGLEKAKEQQPAAGTPPAN